MNPDRAPGHGGNAGLCFEDHICPPCEAGTGPCLDLFQHPICGTVACTANETPEEKAIAAGLDPEQHVEWGIRVSYASPDVEGFTSPVNSERAADAHVHSETSATVVKVRRHVTDWEEVPTTTGDEPA